LTRRTYSQMYQSAETAARYDNEICDAEGRDAPLWSAERACLLRLIRRHFPDHQSAEALDFACGTGRISALLRPLVRSLTCVDISQAMLDRAKQRVGEVEIICADIVASPKSVPGDKDIITSFRFLLLAESELRVACIRELGSRLRSDRSILILNTHGNPWSFRGLAMLRDRMLRRDRRLPAFSLGDMRRLAKTCGLRVVAATGLGFVPGVLAKQLPARVLGAMERALAGFPLLWRLGIIQLVVLRRDPRA
jgi:SAM-dependent methyltransferase